MDLLLSLSAIAPHLVMMAFARGMATDAEWTTIEIAQTPNGRQATVILGE